MKTVKKILCTMLVVVMCLTVAPLQGFVELEWPNLSGFFAPKASAAYENTHQNTGNQRYDIVEVAKTQLNYVEGSGNNNKYGAHYNKNYAPWCAYFVSWCAEMAGISDSIIHRQGVASPFSGYFNIPNSHGNKSYFPKTGDLVFYGPNSNGDHYHVGIVETVNSSTGYITTIEGNTNNNGSAEGTMVYRHTRHYQDSRICCYGIPNYTEAHEHIYEQRHEAAHPHRIYKKCNCGDYYYTGENAETYYTFYEADHPHKEYAHCNICENGYYTGVTTYLDSCEFCKSMDSNWKFENYEMPRLYNVKANSDFEFSGIVKCDVIINWIGIVIYNNEGDEIASLHTYPGANSCDISCMNNQFDFSSLSAGKYKILVHANNRNNDYAYLYFENFNVGAPTLAGPEVNVRTTSAGKAEISWSAVENADNYDVRIFKSTGETYQNSWGVVGTSYEILLPDGDYYVWMCSSNSNFHSCYTYGNVVYFTIKNTLPSKPQLINLNSEYSENEPIVFEWQPTERTTHYNLYLLKLNEQTDEYSIYDYNMHYVESGYRRNLSAGKYKVKLQSTNSETWDYSDGDWMEFSVLHCYDCGEETILPTCQSEGVKTFTCTLCKAIKTESIEKNVSNHIGGTELKNYVDATCTEYGYTGDTYCLGCGIVIVKGKDIPMNNHNDNNNDGKCDACGILFEPETPPSADCSCNCHKGGLAGFFFRLINFFQKLFGQNKVCACGASH
ncbi:MAG: CHAP domain-containing protein [Acutalibacteraceae bacterium]